MSEKFKLQWNDFQSNILQTFRRIREDKDFLNVTLITEDEVQLEAHKVILSASSSFLENILRKSPHKHPMLFLSGMNSKNLNLILDYVYLGEVQVIQEDLQDFLSAASKLKIAGLSSVDHIAPHPGMQGKEDNVSIEGVMKIEPKLSTNFLEEDEHKEDHPEQKKKEKITVVKNPDTGDTDMEHLNLVISEYTERISSTVFTCKLCQKTAKDRCNLGKHIEKHLDGLCFSCNGCQKQFRCRDSLRLHKCKEKKIMSL